MLQCIHGLQKGTLPTFTLAIGLPFFHVNGYVLTRSPLLLSPWADLFPLQPHTGTDTGSERARAIGWAWRDAEWPIAMPRDGGGASSLREPRTGRGCMRIMSLMWLLTVSNPKSYHQCSPPPHRTQRTAHSPGTESPRPWRRHLKHNDQKMSDSMHINLFKKHRWSALLLTSTFVPIWSPLIHVFLLFLVLTLFFQILNRRPLSLPLGLQRILLPFPLSVTILPVSRPGHSSWAVDGRVALGIQPAVGADPTYAAISCKALVKRQQQICLIMEENIFECL